METGKTSSNPVSIEKKEKNDILKNKNEFEKMSDTALQNTIPKETIRAACVHGVSISPDMPNRPQNCLAKTKTRIFTADFIRRLIMT